MKTVSGGEDNDAHVWNLGEPDPSVNPVPLHGHEGAVNLLALTDDNRLVTAGSDPIARIWELEPINPAIEPVVGGGTCQANNSGSQAEVDSPAPASTAPSV